MTRARVPHRRSSRGPLVVRLLVLAGALAGLLAMHGLAGHRISSHAMDAPIPPALTTISHAGHAADAALGDTDAVVTGAPDAHGEHSPGMAMAGLCLAVLAGAVIGLLLLRPERVVLIRATTRALVAARSPGRRDRDPPCLFELSVLRT